MSGYTIPRYNRFCNSRAFGVLDKVHLSTGERHDLALSSWEVNASDIMCVPDIHQHWRLVAAVAQLPHATSRGARLEAAAEVLMLPPSVYHDFWRGDCSTPATGIAQPCRIPPLHLLGILRADKKWFLWMNDEKVLLVEIDVPTLLQRSKTLQTTFYVSIYVGLCRICNNYERPASFNVTL